MESVFVFRHVHDGMREALVVDTNLLSIDIPDNRFKGNKLHAPWEVMLQNLSVPIAIACAAGATKAFIDLLKTWVEERKGRAIRIRCGDQEIELKGGVTSEDVQRAVNLFEERFGRSRIIEP